MIAGRKDGPEMYVGSDGKYIVPIQYQPIHY